MILPPKMTSRFFVLMAGAITAAIATPQPGGWAATQVAHMIWRVAIALPS